jgi:SSS family solute:Na+ symporter
LDIVSFLWLNFIGALMTIIVSILLQFFIFKNEAIEIIEESF